MHSSLDCCHFSAIDTEERCSDDPPITWNEEDHVDKKRSNDDNCFEKCWINDRVSLMNVIVSFLVFFNWNELFCWDQQGCAFKQTQFVQKYIKLYLKTTIAGLHVFVQMILCYIIDKCDYANVKIISEIEYINIDVTENMISKHFLIPNIYYLVI